MQHISPSWHCGRNTRRGSSNRLTTNLLCLAALFLFALMPSTGWAQTRVGVSTAQQFRAALETDGNVTIDIDADFILFNGHTATNSSGSKEYNSLYRVAPGKKTINGKNHTIRRGTVAEGKYYANSSIVLEPGAHLVINNLTLDGKDAPNYASMVVVPPEIKKTTKNGSSSTYSEYTVNAKLEMTNCTIQNCLQRIVTDTELTAFHNTQVSSLNAYDYEAFASTSNNGGAGVHFAPGKAMSGIADNRISLNGCIFKANKIQKRTEVQGDALKKYENGGALALAGEFARGGTIEGCKFQQNYARNYGGAIWFEENLGQSYPFQFLGTTLVGGSVAMKNWSEECGGGIAVEGGHVIFDGEMYIRYNTTGIEGGGIYAEGGKLEFTSSGPDDFIDISYNEAAERGGGGICMKSYVTDPPVTTNLEVIAHDDCYMDISNNTAAYGGGICVGNNHAVDEDQSPYWSARIHFNSGSNDANSDSGRINIYQNKALQPGVLDGEGGGGIFVREKSNVSGVKTTFTNCIVHHNVAKANSYVAGRPARGGGVAVVHSTALFDGCHIYNNGTVKFEGATGTEASDDSGGGVSVTQNSTNPTFRNCHIYNNGTYNNGNNTGIGNTNVTTLTSKGGGVFVGKEAPAVSFIGCRIYNNEAIRGGGLYMAAEGAKLKDACHVYGNRAHEEDPPRPDLWKHEKGGGGIFYEKGKFEGINYVYDNTTDSLGGGMFVYKPSNAEIQGLVIGSNISQATDNLGNKAQRGGGIYAYSSDYAADATNYSLTINNCKIVYNQKDKNNTPIITGGGLWMGGKKSITVKLAGGTLIDHNKADDGGGVYVHNDGGVSKHTLELINTTLSNNIATLNGGGIYNDEQIVTSANNNDTITFHGNRAVEGNGGGIHNGRITDNENGQVLLTGTNPHIFTKNSAQFGGGIYNKENSTCSLNNCQIGQSGKGNEAANSGGGIYNGANTVGVTAIATTTLFGDITFEDNHAKNGGGIFNQGKVTQEDPCTLIFDNNRALLDGGGIYHTGKPLTLTGAIFKNNEATMNGGGIYHVGDPLTLTNAIFKNNTATEDGGGIYTAKKCTLNNCKIGEPNDDSSTNSATNGGGIYKENDELTIQGGWVSHNTASINGGGIYLERKNTLVNNNCRIQKNVATNNGGGIYVKGGEEGALQGGAYGISAFTVLGPNNDTVGWIDRQTGFNNLTDVHVSHVEIEVGFENTIFEWDAYYGITSNVITFDPNNPVISEFWIGVYVNDGQPQIWDNGNYEFIARFKHNGSDDYFELGGNSIDFVNYEYYYEYYDEEAQVVAPIVPTILTLNGSTVGGAGMGNTANHDGGGIYIEKNAKVIMTSDTNGEYDDAIRNEVTHNQADHHGGGVYKDGTLQVEGKVIITGNEAGGGSKAGEVPENVYIPTESDDDQTILIIGELACGSSIGVTKTKKWMKEGAGDENATTTPATAQYGTQGEHIYDRDDHLKQVRTAIAKVSPSSPTQTWAENAFHKRIFFDDKGYYRVWSFNYSNSTNTDNAYSDQNDYFIETWRSFADADGFNNDTVSTNAGFAYFAKQVNDGETVSAASQNATIDLAGHYWEPIGYTFCADCDNEPDVPFDGIYNGNGHFILNAISILPEKEMGLFGNVTGTVKHTFAVGNLFANTHDHASNNHGSAGLGAIVGKTTGTIDGCEAAGFTLKGYATSPATVAAGGIAGNVGASGEVRNSFTSGITFTGTITNAGGLVGNIASGGAVKNCYSKAAIPASGNTKGALVGKNAGTLSNAYTSATTGAIVGSGTAGTNVYSAGASGQTDTYTPTIGADHLGYMCIDNGVATFNKTGLTEGKDYFKFENASGSEVELMPLFRLLNLNAKALNNNNSDNYTTYAEWARPALAFYEGLGESASTTGSINSPINGDLPLLMLNNYDGSTHIGQGGFRSVGTYGGGGDVLQYGGPDRDGNELDAALTRPKVSGFTGNDYLFVYGDVDVAPTAQPNAFTQAKVSIYEHAAISRAGTLAGFNQTYVGVTFDNSAKNNGSATNGINFIHHGPTLPRNWHIISTPVSNAPLGFHYPGNQNSNLYTTGNYSSSNYFNNPWGNENGANSPNSPSANEFTWLNGGSAGHNRYWMYGWDNSRDAGTHDDSSYPANTWVDGYFPSKVNTSAIQFGKQLFIEADGQNGSNEYVGGNHRYPYGMDLYSWYEPMYHYINFKRNGPNHWHSDMPHVHLDYTPEQASNNAGVFGTNVNETTLLDGKGYMASIHIPTFLQTSGSLGGSTKTIKVTYNQNKWRLCEGWNIVGNPFHSYLDFNEFCKDNPGVNNTYIVYNADGFQKESEDEFTYGNGFSYYVAGGSQHGAYASQYLHPHQGFFVKVSSNETLNFTESQTVLRSQIGTSGSYRDDSRPAYPLVNLFLTSDKGCSDVCVVEFNRPEWGGASKLRDMYSGNGMFYATHDDANYAALFATPEAERIPLKFEAKDEAGDTYTIHWNTQNGDFYKLYLVDNITGVNYDMLRNDSYSFSGKKSDYWSRFYITFGVTDVDEHEDEDDITTGGSFAFFDGTQWVVTGGGTLEMIDLQGRVLYSTNVVTEGQARVSLPKVSNGMYLLRMSNENGTRVQKIVVR